MDNPRLRNSLVHQWDNLPDLEAVRMFAAVAELKSFRGAADLLKVPRSTVSRRLSLLEGALKTRLLQRTTRHVSLTDAGEAFLKQLSPALLAISDAGRAVVDTQREPRGLVRMTATHGVAGRVGAILLGLVEKYPGVRLDLHFTDRQVDLVAEGFDLAVRAGVLADSTLVSRPLGVSQVGYFASPAYLKRAPKLKAPGDLLEHDCVVFTGTQRGSNWRFTDGKKVLDVTVRGHIMTNDLGVVRLSAVRGQGVAWLPEQPAREDVSKGRLVPVLRTFWPEPTPIQLVYPSARHLAPQVRAAVELLVQGLKPIA